MAAAGTIGDCKARSHAVDIVFHYLAKWQQWLDFVLQYVVTFCSLLYHSIKKVKVETGLNHVINTTGQP